MTTPDEAKVKEYRALIAKLRNAADKMDTMFELSFVSPWREAANAIEALLPPEKDEATE